MAADAPSRHTQRLSTFGTRFSAQTGIHDLMEDLGRAKENAALVAQLGGGNPALIPEVGAIWRRRMVEILGNSDEFERLMGTYDPPQGRSELVDAAVTLLRRTFHWPITRRNVAITNGSQSAFFVLLNMFAGNFGGGAKKRILFPIIPEYIGYGDQALDDGAFLGCKPAITELGDHTFKYAVDFSSLPVDDRIGAICVSRPTNPSGNVLTDREIEHLAGIAADRSIPLLIDNAYGTPFPHIIFEEVRPFWNEHTVVSLSLSKIGLPALRTGLIVASEEVISALAAANAVINLATGSFGPALVAPLLRSGEILRVSEAIVRPYYERRSRSARQWLVEALDGRCEFSVHKCEGSIFLWVWFKDLPIPTRALYERLKARGVYVIPGKYFFYGLDEPWHHDEECIRLSYAQSEDQVQRGIGVLADEIQAVMNER